MNHSLLYTSILTSFLLLTTPLCGMEYAKKATGAIGETVAGFTQTIDVTVSGLIQQKKFESRYKGEKDQTDILEECLMGVIKRHDVDHSNRNGRMLNFLREANRLKRRLNPVLLEKVEKTLRAWEGDIKKVSQQVELNKSLENAHSDSSKLGAVNFETITTQLQRKIFDSQFPRLPEKKVTLSQALEGAQSELETNSQSIFICVATLLDAANKRSIPLDVTLLEGLGEKLQRVSLLMSELEKRRQQSLAIVRQKATHEVESRS